MQFKILYCSEIDSTKWNERVDSNQSEVYNEFYYLSACTLNNWYGVIWGDYEKILPFYSKKKFGIIPYICMPPFCQNFDTSSLTEDEFSEVMGYFKKKNWVVDYRIYDTKPLKGFTEKKNYILHKKDKSAQEIQSGYSTLLKKNLRKSEELSIAEIANELALHFLENNPLFQETIYKKHQKNYAQLAKMEHLKFIAAQFDNEIVGVLGFYYYHHTAYLLFPFINEKGRKLQAMSGLIHKLTAENKIESINFEGSSIESIANYYKQFGPEEVSYYEMTWSRI